MNKNALVFILQGEAPKGSLYELIAQNQFNQSIIKQTEHKRIVSDKLTVNGGLV